MSNSVCSEVYLSCFVLLVEYIMFFSNIFNFISKLIWMINFVYLMELCLLLNYNLVKKLSFMFLKFFIKMSLLIMNLYLKMKYANSRLLMTVSNESCYKKYLLSDFFFFLKYKSMDLLKDFVYSLIFMFLGMKKFKMYFIIFSLQFSYVYSLWMMCFGGYTCSCFTMKSICQWMWMSWYM